jgi:RimJ/RimL family protein N-acetyltransferase
MLEGKSVNLRIMEREDLPIIKEWVCNPEFVGEYEPFNQETIKDLEKQYDELGKGQWFFIEKKDGAKVGYMCHFLTDGKQTELGYAILPVERNKGYCTEALQIMVDYLFCGKPIVRIQVHTDERNTPSHRILEKAGFRKEGILRKNYYSRGQWTDSALFSILREEWKEPRILTLQR